MNTLSSIIQAQLQHQAHLIFFNTQQFKLQSLAPVFEIAHRFLGKNAVIYLTLSLNNAWITFVLSVQRRPLDFYTDSWPVAWPGSAVLDRDPRPLRIITILFRRKLYKFEKL